MTLGAGQRMLVVRGDDHVLIRMVSAVATLRGALVASPASGRLREQDGAVVLLRDASTDAGDAVQRARAVLADAPEIARSAAIVLRSPVGSRASRTGGGGTISEVPSALEVTQASTLRQLLILARRIVAQALQRRHG
jgi:hypothetical protein